MSRRNALRGEWVPMDPPLHSRAAHAVWRARVYLRLSVESTLQPEADREASRQNFATARREGRAS